MNNTLIKALAVSCLSLLTILVVEWLLIGGLAEQNDTIDPSGQQQDLSVELPKYIAKIQALESYDEMLERPLFIKTRRPIEGDDMVETLDQIQGEIKDLELQGIYSVNGEMTVLFNKKGVGRNYLKRTSGQDVAGWQIKEIQNDRVVLESKGKEQTVMLRKPKPKVQKPQRKTKPRSRTRPKLEPQATESMSKLKS